MDILILDAIIGLEAQKSKKITRSCNRFIAQIFLTPSQNAFL
jgi:hypothetical protein